MKKGQVTVFIILGIVIVAIIAFVFYYSGIISKSSFQKEAEKAKTIPVQARPVKDYIDNCVEEIAIEGILLMGQQGGYIEIPKDVLPRSVINPFSNSLELFSGYNVPYWFYETTNGIQKSQIPSIEIMEEQLEGYLNQNMDSCLFNLSLFRSYDIKFEGEAKSDVVITDERIDVNVIYPILVDIEGVTTEMKEHFASINVPLGRMYEMSKDIMKKENDEFFLEKVTEDSLVIYDDIPYHGESLSCQPKTWLKQDVERQLKEILSLNINALKIADSENSNLADDYFRIRIDRNNYRDIESNFMYYDNWPFELEINGGEEILKEESATGSTGLLLNLLCINTHNFIYDINYPVLISLYDDKSLGGFTFQFATHVIIDNNQPRENQLGNLEFGSTDKRICESADKPFRIYAVNQESNEFLSNAIVRFTCTGTLCDLGRTELDSYDEYSLRTNLPQCLNAIIDIAKEGYNKEEVVLDTLESADLFVYLKPIHDKELVIKVIDGGRIRDLRSDESIIIEFSSDSNEYSVTVTNQDSEVGLVEGNYFIKSYITRDRKIKLDSKDVEYCSDVPRSGILGILGSKTTKCYTTTIEGVDLDSVIIGGTEFGFDFDNLNRGNQLVFYSVINSVPASIEDLQKVYEKIPENDKTDGFRYPELR